MTESCDRGTGNQSAIGNRIAVRVHAIIELPGVPVRVIAGVALDYRHPLALKTIDDLIFVQELLILS